MDYRALIDAVSADTAAGDPMWTDRTVQLLEALEAAGVDLTGKTPQSALDAMIAAASDHPGMARYLEDIPGYPASRAMAERMLGYLMLHVGINRDKASLQDEGNGNQ